MVCLRPLFGWHNGKQMQMEKTQEHSVWERDHTPAYIAKEREKERIHVCVHWSHLFNETRQNHSKLKGLKTASWGTPLCRMEFLHTGLLLKAFNISINCVRSINLNLQEFHYCISVLASTVSAKCIKTTKRIMTAMTQNSRHRTLLNIAC